MANFSAFLWQYLATDSLFPTCDGFIMWKKSTYCLSFPCSHTHSLSPSPNALYVKWSPRLNSNPFLRDDFFADFL